MRSDPPPLPAQGFLLARLGYIEEELAAIAIDVSLPTMIDYRKRQIGPDFTTVGRTILYHPARLEAWLAAGGTRAFEAEAPAAPASDRKPPRRDAPIKNELSHATPRPVPAPIRPVPAPIRPAHKRPLERTR